MAAKRLVKQQHNQPHKMSSSSGQSARKVRMACRRCRLKRVKCDGQIPACGNCQKAKEPCIDVDTRNSAISIRRDFTATARARVEWLEQQIRRLSPGFNLEDGPNIDFSSMDGFDQIAPASSNSNATASSAERPLSTAASASSRMTDLGARNSPGKRAHASFSESDVERPFTDEARSVALDLGLLSLNTDSRQTHYLGTSSGRLFTSLIGTSGAQSVTGTPQKSLTSPSRSGKSGPYAFSTQYKNSCKQLYELLRKNLPSQEDARSLLDIYFQSIHGDHPFIHPASLSNALDCLYQCAAGDITAPVGHRGWLASVDPFSYNGDFDTSRGQNSTPVSVFTATFHVFMVFTLAATVRTRERVYDFAPNQFLKVAMSVAQETFSNTSIASLQATLFLAVHSLRTPAELNIWTLTYVAMAHCIDLGLHRNPREGQLSSAAIITRQMIFYCVYNLDRSVATIQGRPLGIRDESFDVRLPTIEEIESDSTIIRNEMLKTDIPLNSVVAFALHRLKLDPIISEIKMLFYHLPTQVNGIVWPSDIRTSQASIRQKLDDWNAELSNLAISLQHESDFGYFGQFSYESKLRCQYYAAMILLFQPSQAVPRPQEDHLVQCYSCASDRLKTYHELYTSDNLFISWRSIHGIFSSGAMMLYCLWVSDAVRTRVPYNEAARSLRTCDNLLSVGGEWWPSVKTGKESFGRAVDALLRILGPNHEPNVTDRSAGPPHRISRSSQLTSSLVPSHIEMYSTSSENPSASHQINPSHLAHIQTDHRATEWAILGHGGDQLLEDDHGDFISSTYDELQPIPSSFGDFPDADLNGGDPTIDAFVTNFFDNNTSWIVF